MIALITGASSGIGRQMAYYLASLNYELILVARRKEELEKIKEEVDVPVTIYHYDLRKEKNLYKLYKNVKEKQIDFLIKLPLGKIHVL